MVRINNETFISVDTPVARTGKEVIHEIVPQGSGGAALASALDLALGLKSYFQGSQDEISYGKVTTQPQAWQDDILRIAEDMKKSSQKSSQVWKSDLPTLRQRGLLRGSDSFPRA